MPEGSTTTTQSLEGEASQRATVQISIALCTHNRADLFQECLSALIPQLGPEFEIFVVDSASSPEHAGRVAALAALYPQVVFIRLDQAGLSLARNTALARSSGAWFATV